VFKLGLRAGGVVERLPSKHEALSSSPNTERKERKRRERSSSGHDVVGSLTILAIFA
jgi:hypothetical protein